MDPNVLDLRGAFPSRSAVKSVIDRQVAWESTRFSRRKAIWLPVCVSLMWSACALLVAVLIDAAAVRWVAVAIAIAFPVMTLVLRWLATRRPVRYANAIATTWGVPEHESQTK